MKIILTGASGFLGSVLKDEWLKSKHDVITLGRSKSNDLIYDLTQPVGELPSCEIVVHAASKAHTIPKNETEEQEYFNINVNGTINLLKSFESHNRIPKTFIYISSVSVYGAVTGIDIDESFKLNATDAYGKSKIEAEEVIKEWCTSKNIDWYIFRLPLIAGPNPKGNLGDMINVMRKGYYFSVGSGSAIKSIVSARAIAQFIVTLSGNSGIYNLVSAPHPTLRQIENILAEFTGKKIRSIPKFLAIVLAKIGDIFPFIPLNSRRLLKITTTLTFSDAKARKTIGWPLCSLSLKEIFS